MLRDAWCVSCLCVCLCVTACCVPVCRVTVCMLRTCVPPVARVAFASVSRAARVSVLCARPAPGAASPSARRTAARWEKPSSRAVRRGPRSPLGHRPLRTWPAPPFLSSAFLPGRQRCGEPVRGAGRRALRRWTRLRSQAQTPRGRHLLQLHASQSV